jgi:S-ribosylhomocysteine lyase LuxS involved in autoinducer biosynthesis
MRIHPLSEGSFTIDHTKVFVPFSASENSIVDKGSLLVEIQPFVVITQNDIILFGYRTGIYPVLMEHCKFMKI